MADERLTALGDRLHESQTRLAYYFMTVNASALALTFAKFDSAVPDWRLTILMASAACWAIGFCFGLRHVMQKNGTILANIQHFKLSEGSHELQPSDPALVDKSQKELAETFAKFNEGAKKAVGWQTASSILGAVLFAVWLVADKFWVRC
jgi:hypothetical protein